MWANLGYFLLHNFFSTLKFIAGDEQMFLRLVRMMFDYPLWLGMHTANWSEANDQEQHWRKVSE